MKSLVKLSPDKLPYHNIVISYDTAWLLCRLRLRLINGLVRNIINILMRTASIGYWSPERLYTREEVTRSAILEYVVILGGSFNKE